MRSSINNPVLFFQVTEYGADLLGQAGIKCELRGVINIKGKGNMRTYFVCMNEKYEIQYNDPVEEGNGVTLSDFKSKLVGTESTDL